MYLAYMQIYIHIIYIVLNFIFSSILLITQISLKMSYSKIRREIESCGIEKKKMTVYLELTHKIQDTGALL